MAELDAQAVGANNIRPTPSSQRPLAGALQTAADIDEVRAAQIDVSGNAKYYILNDGTIASKALNLATGGVSLKRYAVIDDGPEPEPAAVPTVAETIIAALSAKIDEIGGKLNELTSSGTAAGGSKSGGKAAAKSAPTVEVARVEPASND
jgi:hypothetical protein